MQTENTVSRRMLVKSSVLGLLAAACPNIIYSRNGFLLPGEKLNSDPPPARYPAIPLDIAAEIVGVSHFDLTRLKELIDPRPELAKANWDWGFGDWESAIAAASHTGRKDIAAYLISKGAMPTIFTLAMLGSYDAVKTMISAYPGIQQIGGPHGISLLQHARLAVDADAGADARKLVDYLESLGDAGGKKYLDVADKEKYLGDYRYAEGENEGFTIKLNMKKVLSLGKLGKSGGALYRTGENSFTYNGAPSVSIIFNLENDRAISLTVHEPGLVLTAVKIKQD